MAVQKGYCEIQFTNAVIIDIFSRYATNSEMAEFVADDGFIKMRFRMENGDIEAPENCEQTLGLMFALFESNPQSTIGRIYTENQQAILREIVYTLSKVLDSFSDVTLTIHRFKSDSSDPSKEIDIQKKIVLKRETKVVTVNE